VVEHCTVAVGNLAEVATVVADRDPESAARSLIGLGVSLAVVKMGPDGVLAATAGQMVHVAPRPVEVVNGLGAGDAFGGALVHGLLNGLPLRRTVERANAAGALVASRLGCADDMPELEEIDRMVGVDAG
jgi:5-dehydro-2-deoxygluconokinase